MNYLAHLALAEPTPSGWAGSILGDRVRGDPRSHYPDAICRGILLHRKIDAYTDAHVIVKRSRQRLGNDYHLLRSAMLDVFFDHFLARHFELFYTVPLEEFAQSCGQSLQQMHAYFPVQLQPRLARMQDSRWLLRYRELDHIEVLLQHMAQRLKRPGRLAQGIEALHRCYAALEQDFDRFFPQLMAYVEGVRAHPSAELNDDSVEHL